MPLAGREAIRAAYGRNAGRPPETMTGERTGIRAKTGTHGAGMRMWRKRIGRGAAFGMPLVGMTVVKGTSRSQEVSMRRTPVRYANTAQSVSSAQRGQHDARDGENIEMPGERSQRMYREISAKRKLGRPCMYCVRRVAICGKTVNAGNAFLCLCASGTHAGVTDEEPGFPISRQGSMTQNICPPMVEYMIATFYADRFSCH